MVTEQQLKDNIIPAVFERPPAGRVKYAGLHRPAGAGVKDLYSAIFNRYAPPIPLRSVSPEIRQRNGWADLPEEIVRSEVWKETGDVYERAATRADGKKVEAGDPKIELVKEKEVVMVKDPDVIWVGRISDGLMWLNAMPVISPHRTASRKLLKDFLHNVPAGEGGTSARCSMVLERDGKRYSLGPRLLDEEPGEITNSPESNRLPRDASADLNVAAPLYNEREFEPRLRMYPDFALHYLKRGDRITYSGQGWPTPRTNDGEAWTMQFVLRPPSEGPSNSNVSSGLDGMVSLV